jgi:hypothetical protein
VNLDPPYALWSIWSQCSRLQHWFCYTLCALCLFAGFCVVSSISNLRSIRHLGTSDAVVYGTVAMLRNRCATLRYAIYAEFYLFGIVLFTAFQFVGQFILGNDIGRHILGQFVLDCAFAANVFVILFILHLAQWVVSCRLSRYSDSQSRGTHP